MSSRDKYKAVIGLEVHAQLATESKIFNSDAAKYGSEPNRNISAITLGHPGTLPVLNEKVLEYAIKMGLACNSTISREMIFDRKNYFYPDLPKGYQITQDRTPICVGGKVRIEVDGSAKHIELNRIHLEEDAGKSIHLADEPDTLVDFNRSGVPLIEIVTEPVLTSAPEAHAFLSEIRKLVRYLEICDGNMEEGSLRCDANVSVMLKTDTELGSKAEVKNLNSMRNVQRAIEFEIDRQIELLESNKEVISETRNFDADSGITTGLRSKEALNDYRYFPDPDLSPVHISDQYLEEIRNSMVELPWEVNERLIKNHNLPKNIANQLSESKEAAQYFDQLCKHGAGSKSAANWMVGPVKSYLNDTSGTISDFVLSPAKLAELILLVEKGMLSFSIASQRLFPKFIESDVSVLALAESLDLIHTSDEDSLNDLIDQIIKEHPDRVEEYKKGKKALLGMFMGEIMKKSGGKADPKKTNELLRKKLS